MKQIRSKPLRYEPSLDICSRNKITIGKKIL